MGREIQREYGQESQVCMTMPILVGLDGAGNVQEPRQLRRDHRTPQEMFGKMMSIPDG